MEDNYNEMEQTKNEKKLEVEEIKDYEGDGEGEHEGDENGRKKE